MLATLIGYVNSIVKTLTRIIISDSYSNTCTSALMLMMKKKSIGSSSRTHDAHSKDQSKSDPWMATWLKIVYLQKGQDNTSLVRFAFTKGHLGD